MHYSLRLEGSCHCGAAHFSAARPGKRKRRQWNERVKPQAMLARHGLPNRALDFLLAQGLIHRIESLNAYVGCVHPDGTHGGQFLICGDCGAAAEVHDPRVDAAIARRAEALGFAVGRKTVEVRGRCQPCQRRRSTGSHVA